MNYTSINILGNLISEDILQKIEQGEAIGQQAKDFGFEPGTNLRSEIEYAWSRIKLDWKHFSERSQNLQAGDPYGTSLARKWMNNFLSSLNFELTAQKSSLQGGNNQSYSISHTAESLDGLPVHIVGFYDPNHPDRNTLDSRSSGGTSRLSPHGTIQEYLNVTEHLYSLVTNGLTMRLIRDSGRLVKLTYVEFDLKRMLDDDKYSEFTVLYRLIHASRFPRSKQEADQCLLEKYYQDSIETGNRIRDGLSEAVQKSLVSLGNGFLLHPDNADLRIQLQNGTLTAVDFYRQLRRLIYRLLFLMVTEERDLLYDPNERSEELLRKKRIYHDFYSISRLRRLSGMRFLHESQFSDLWQGLVHTFRLFEAGGKGDKLGIMPLDGDLFSSSAIQYLESCVISNQLLLACILNLNEFRDKKNDILVSINYRALDVEELGSVYEGLLDLHPVIEGLSAVSAEENISEVSLANLNFTFHEGTDRKTTGSYYTRPDLVNELIKSALIPVIEERLAEVHKKSSPSISDSEKVLLSLKVCDSASGSGHMLLAAARTIAWYLARVRSGEDNPAPAIYRICLRETIQHCVYGVDMNPDAVELCKLALWLESHNSGKPLSFLDHKIRCGNSLVGVTDLEVLKRGIPDDAFNPVTGDDKEVCQELKKINSAFNRTKQYDLFGHHASEPEVHDFSTEYNEMEEIRQDTINAVQKARDKFEHLRSNPNWYNDWTACNLWTSAFFYTYNDSTKKAAPTSENLGQFLRNPSSVYAPMVGKANALFKEHKFFHWPLEFPDVFNHGGFDVMLGNPPWEIVELNAKEFFKVRNEEIVNATSDKIRKGLIEKLLEDNPELYKLFQTAKHDFDSQRKFIQESDRFPNGSVGRIDLYPLFVENAMSLISRKGIIGLVLPSDIATGAYNADLFSKIILEKRLKCYFDFENSKAIFPGVHRSKRFCLLALTGGDLNSTTIDFFYFGHDLSDLLNKERRIRLRFDELELFSPNTLAPPIFQTSIDFKISKKVYSELGVFINKKNNTNLWQASIRRMLSLSDNGVEFIKNIQLSADDKNKLCRMYSGKNIFQYNHRYASNANEELNQIDVQMLGNENFSIETEYYVPEEELNNRLKDKKPSKWLIGYRDVTNATNERTTIASFLPRVACDTNCRNIYSDLETVKLVCLMGNLNSVPFDYLARQKIIGLHLNSGTLEQLPVLHPDKFVNELIILLIPQIFELSYTSWDIKLFADDVWKEADEMLRVAIKQQWAENQIVSGGHPWTPPEWCEDYDLKPEAVNGCPLPPFKWDEERRVSIKAELDAIYARLYGLTTEELRYILDPQDVYGPDFPGETFRVLKEKEMRLYGEYRTRRLVLEAWERMDSL